MSETVSPGREAGQRAARRQQEALVAKRRTRRGRGHGGWVAAGLVAVTAGVVAGWRAGIASSPPASAGSGSAATSTAAVSRQDLSATMPVAATIGYAHSYTVNGLGGGTLTGLPQPGQVISQGQVLYRTGNGSPVVLLYGTVPAWRALSEGVSGTDVSQLNHDLVALGDASSANVAAAGWDYFSAETAYGVQRLEQVAGLPAASGSLSLGQAVFEPEAIRVAQVTGSLGGPAAGPVLQATSDDHVVTIALDTSQESHVQAGDAVRVTLPDGMSTPGLVSQVGTVSTTSTSAGTTTTTVPVTVALIDPAAAGGLDEAAVTVYITTATARDVLAVPVTALLARPRGYDVEVEGPGNSRRYVPVRVGPVFDDNSGLVQVAGALTPGQRIVAASS